MLNCGAIFARSGTLNTRCTVGLASKGTNVQRHVSTITRNKLLGSHVPELQQLCTPETQIYRYAVRTLTSDTLVKSINSSCARALCLRKIRTHLLAQSSCCTTDVSSKTNVRHISKGDITEEEINRLHNPEGGNIKNIFEDTSAKSHHHETKHHAHKHELKYTDIEKMYLNPRSKLNDVYQSIGGQLKQEKLLKIAYTLGTQDRKKRLWNCTLTVRWPENMEIVGTASAKPLAHKIAAIKCLQWLHKQGKLTSEGNPIVYDSKAVKQMLSETTPVVISESLISPVRDLIEEYNTEIKELLNYSSSNAVIRDISLQEGTVPENPVGRVSAPLSSPSAISYRNSVLETRQRDRPPSQSAELPIAAYREKIIEAIDKNRALLIKGDTGCGKTTQVPQYIMDSFAARGRASDCNMIVSQPRRISAISLAERIASERNERVGDVVGYQVRLQRIMPLTPGAMLFCTTGVLLRKLQSNPTLEGCSHVILDEAHERSINTDMLMVLLKRALQKNPQLKVVVMSATINADLFQEYFDCGVIDVPGRTYPVKMNFLEDIEKLGVLRRKEYMGKNIVPESPFVDCEQIGELVAWIANTKPPGAILCFLPGWAEIGKVKRYLEQRNDLDDQCLIVPVHSRMSQKDQHKIFARTRPGERKIVLATDIAETGITVTDVVYVVDSATKKGMRWHEKEGVTSMDTQYASQANVQQRKGRAGRVQPGTSYHMVTREQFENLPVHPMPEVLCSSLERTVLDCKTYSNEKAESFLGSMPQPPTLAAVRRAVSDLVELGALDREENLTPLGRRIALLTVHPKLGKAMVYASIFQCVSPVITIASAMSGECEIFSGTLFDKENIRRTKQQYHPTSDHISIVWLFEKFAEIQDNRHATNNFCYHAKIIPERMALLSRIRELYAEHLVQCHMLKNVEEYDDPDGIYNQYGGLDEMVRAVIFAGMDHMLQQRDFELRKHRVKKGTVVFIMEDGTRATVTQESVNFKRKQFPSPFLTYVRRQHSEERRTSLIRETSIISPVTALLFNQSQIHGFEMDKTADDNNNDDDNRQILLTIKGRKNMKISSTAETADALLKLRDAMWNVVRYFVENQGLISSSPDHVKIEQYKHRMLQTVAKVLDEAAQTIDNPPAAAAKNKTPKDDDEDYSD